MGHAVSRHDWQARLDVRRAGVFLAVRVRQGWRRVRGSFWPVVVSAIGASLAWLIAHDLMGHPSPVFAPIATWICLGFKRDRVPRKVAELGAGATVGVLVGELFSQFLELGWWQIILVLVTAAMFGRFLDRGELFTIQTGVNGIVVVGMSWWTAQAGGVTGRALDALTGSAVAFVIAVLLPRRPTERPQRYARATWYEMATALDMLAQGLRASDVEQLRDVRGQLRGVRQVTADWEATLDTANEVVLFNPTLGRARSTLAELNRLHTLAERTEATMEMLSRQALSMVEEVGRVPVIGELVDDCAAAAHRLAAAIARWERPEVARELLLAVAGRTAPAEIHSSDWRPTALMSLVRALTVDLLQATGLSRAAARATLTDTWGLTYAEAEADEVVAAAEADPEAAGPRPGSHVDGPSALWE